MPALSLLFDPRGAIDRSTFWSGLLQLALVSLAVSLGLTRLDLDGAMAVLPVSGEGYAIADIAGRVYQGGPPDISLTASVLIVAARYYAVACLMLKRSRHAGLGARAVVAFGLANLVVHGLMGWWACAVFGEGMAVLLPVFADMAASALVWTIFLVWIGALGAGAAKPAAAPMAVRFE